MAVKSFNLGSHQGQDWGVLAKKGCDQSKWGEVFLSARKILQPLQPHWQVTQLRVAMFALFRVN